MVNSDYRLLVLDIDGTLVGESGVPSERVRAALQAVQQRGVHVALCSGRPLSSCWPLARTLGLRGPQVAFNGALVRDPGSGRTVLKRPLDKAIASRVIEYCRASRLCLELYTEEAHYVEEDWPEARLHSEIIRVPFERQGFDDLLRSQEIIKAQLVTADEHSRGLASDLIRGLEGAAGMSWAILMPPEAGMAVVNVVDRQVSKGEAVKSLIAHYGLVRDQVMAAGDAPNDLPVFAEVGFRIVMGNAEASLRQQADYVAPSVGEDGLAVAIEHLLLARAN